MKKKKKIYFIIIAFIIVLLLNLNNNDLRNLYTSINNKINPETEIINNSNIIDSTLKVYFIDVGQADCILIQNQNQNMLIDAGNNSDGEKITNYLKSLNIINFKYVIGTHPHEDHIGGLDNIIDNFNIEEVFLPDVYTTTLTFEDVLNSLENKNMQFTVPQIDSILTLGDAQISILHAEEDPDDLNDASIVLRIDFGDNSFLFTGDATSEVEKKLINKNIDVDVYKVAHHGSRYSNSKTFLNKVSPKYAIISCGKDNSYGHPHNEVIKKLNDNNIEIYRTDEKGTILITSDGKNINIKNFNTNTNG